MSRKHRKTCPPSPSSHPSTPSPSSAQTPRASATLVALPSAILAHCASFCCGLKRMAWASTCRTLRAIDLLSQSVPPHLSIRCAAILHVPAEQRLELDDDDYHEAPESALVLRPGHQWTMRFLSRHYRHVYSLEVHDAQLLTDQMLAFLATTWSRQENRNLSVMYGIHTRVDRELGRDATELLQCAASIRVSMLPESLRPMARLTRLGLRGLTMREVGLCPNVTRLDLCLGFRTRETAEQCKDAFVSIAPRLLECKLRFETQVHINVFALVFRELLVCRRLTVWAINELLPLAALSQAPHLTYMEMCSVTSFAFRSPEAREVASANIQTVLIRRTRVSSCFVRTLAHFFRNKRERLTLIVFQECSFDLIDLDFTVLRGLSSLEHVVVQPKQKDEVDPCVALMCEQLRIVCPRFKRVLVTREWLGDLACAHAPPTITCPSSKEELSPFV